MKKTNNKGFSLVELIIVIAIMAVLVGILAPQFIKYVGNSRVSTDIKNGQEIAAVISAGTADGTIIADVTTPALCSALPADVLAMLGGSVPTLKASYAATSYYYYTVTVSTGALNVYIGSSPAAADLEEIYPNADAFSTNHMN